MLRKQFGYLCLFCGMIFFLSACDQASMPTSSLTDGPDESVAQRAGDIVQGRYIVVFKDQSELAGKTVRQVVETMTEQDGVESDQIYDTVLHGFAGTFSDAAIEEIKNDPNVAYVEPDSWVTLPPISSEGLCDKNPNHPKCQPSDPGTNPDEPAPADNEITPWGIKRVGGGSSYAGSNVAWIIDTGVDLDHPDLNVDVGRSESFLSGKESDNPDDQNGHGTHVAGTIAALDNGVDVVGVAAGAKVVSVRVLDRRGSGWNSGVIAGVDYVAANASNGDVANMSLGGGVSIALDAAVMAASTSVRFALAAGNESDHADNHSPARVNGSNIYTVSAVNSSDRFASFSNYGNPPIDYAAPGVSILSLWKNGGTNTISGTSMAAPHVAGILLFGTVQSDGNAEGDPDGNPDPIAHR